MAQEIAVGRVLIRHYTDALIHEALPNDLSIKEAHDI
jgi:hypothetical protein